MVSALIDIATHPFDETTAPLWTDATADTLATTAGEGHVCLIYRREDEMPKVKHPLFTSDVQALVVPESEVEEVIAQSEARPIARYRMSLL